MKNVFYFYLKTKGTFWPTQYMTEARVRVWFWPEKNMEKSLNFPSQFQLTNLFHPFI